MLERTCLGGSESSSPRIRPICAAKYTVHSLVLRPNMVTQASYIVRTQRPVLRCFRVGGCHYEHTTRVCGQLRLYSEPLQRTEGYLRSTCWLCCMLSPVLLGYVLPDPDVRFTTNWTTVMVTGRTYISSGIRLTIRRRVLELK